MICIWHGAKHELHATCVPRLARMGSPPMSGSVRAFTGNQVEAIEIGRAEITGRSYRQSFGQC